MCPETHPRFHGDHPHLVVSSDETSQREERRCRPRGEGEGERERRERKGGGYKEREGGEEGEGGGERYKEREGERRERGEGIYMQTMTGRKGSVVCVIMRKVSLCSRRIPHKFVF